LQLLLLLSIQIHWFLLLMLHIRHTCFFTIVHGSPWFVSTNSKCFAAAKMCTWSTYQFSTDFRKAKYFQLQECWWFPASRFVKISIDKLLNSIREEESVFDLVSIRWQRMFLGLEGTSMFTRFCHSFHERSHFYNLEDSSVGATKMFLWQVSNQSIKVKGMHACLLSSQGIHWKSRKWLWKCSKRAGENSSITTRPKRIHDEDDGIVRSHKKNLRKVSAKSRAW
jgi:hypothetical protein